MPLTRADVEEMRALAGRLHRGSVSRHDWSTLAALTIIAQGPETCAAISARGLDEFIRISKPVFEGHAFKFNDFKRMYERICRSTATVN